MMKISSDCLSKMFLIMLLINLISCAHEQEITKPIDKTDKTILINNSSFLNEVKEYKGFVLVLFFNRDYPQSRDMENHFDNLADKFYGDAKFCKFHWDVNSNPASYKLQMLPTLVLYDSGNEIDRIKGIHPDETIRMKLDDDLELWFMKNVLKLEGSKYQGNYIYRFNNTHELQISNY